MANEFLEVDFGNGTDGVQLETLLVVAWLTGKRYMR
jgi:hypothetical protein